MAARFPRPTLETARAEVAADPVCGRLDVRDREVIAASAWRVGREEGMSRLPRRSGEFVPMVEALGVRVVVDDVDLDCSRGLFSEYNTAHATITLHRGALRQWADACRTSWALAEGMALAHEFFHHLECRGAIDVQRAVARIPRLVVLGRPWGRCRPRGVCEAGAHGFASVMVQWIAMEQQGEECVPKA